MLASICRRRRLVLAFHQIFAGGDGGARNRIHPSPNTFLLTHLSSLTAVAPNAKLCPNSISDLVSCGVSPATVVHKVRIRDTDRADAIRNLREYGLSDEEVTRTVREDPRLLTCSLDKHLAPCVDFLRGILGTEDNVRLAMSRKPRALLSHVDNKMRPAVEAFRRHGLSKEPIAKLLLTDLCVLMMPIERIAEAFGILKELNMCPTDTNFLYVFRVMCFLGRETWQRKVVLFQILGLTVDVLIRAFKTQPSILSSSEEVIKEEGQVLRGRTEA